MKTLKKLSRNIVLSTALLATAAHLAINHFFAGAGVDVVSAALYVGLGLVIAYVFGKEKFSALQFAILGVGVSLAFNLSGMIFGWFSATNLFIAAAALQQGAIFYLVAKMEGVKG